MKYSIFVVFMFIVVSCGQEKSEKKQQIENSKISQTSLVSDEICVEDAISQNAIALMEVEEKIQNQDPPKKKCVKTWYAPINVYPYGSAGPFSSKTECELKKGYFTGACYFKCSCGGTGR